MLGSMGLSWGEWPSNDVLCRQRDEGRATVRSERHENIDRVGKLPQGICQGETRQRVAAPTVKEQIESRDLADQPKMLREARDYVVTNLRLLVLSVSGEIASEPRPPHIFQRSDQILSAGHLPSGLGNSCPVIGRRWVT